MTQCMRILVVTTDTHVYVWLWIMRSEKLTVEHRVPGLNFLRSRQPQDNPQSGTIQIITCLLPSFLPYPPLPPLHFSLTFPNPSLSFLPSFSFPLLSSPLYSLSRSGRILLQCSFSLARCSCWHDRTVCGPALSEDLGWCQPWEWPLQTKAVSWREEDCLFGPTTYRKF